MHDAFAVREVIERFHDAVNQRKPAAIAALFAENGVWEVAPPYEFEFEGRAAIEAGTAGTIGATEVLVQSCGPIVVELVDATHAKARTSMQEFGRFQDGASMHVAGTYHDELERQGDGAWRFVHRRFVAHYADDHPVSGKALLEPKDSIAGPRAELSEHQAIADIVSRFAGLISAKDFATAAGLFTENAVWDSSAGELSFHHEGRVAIHDFLKASTARVEALYYLVGAPTITLLGEGRARSRVALSEVLHIKATGERRLLLGTYVDELEKVDGVWRFTNRHVTVNHMETLRGTSAP